MNGVPRGLLGAVDLPAGPGPSAPSPGGSPAVRARSLLQHAFTLDSGDLGRRVAHGAAYKFLGIGLRTVLTLVSTAIMARLLSPADFGYVAMATVVTELAGLFSGLGFTEMLVQRRRISRLQLDTVFWASLAVGVFLTVAVFIASIPAAWLFADRKVEPLLQVMCLTFVVNSLGAVPGVVLARMLLFRVDLWINLATVVIRTTAAIVAALLGLGMWSLVVGALAGSISATALSYLAVPYVPRPRFQRRHLTESWRTSSFYFAGGLLYYVNMSADLFLLGRYLGVSPLGIYQNARSLTDEIRARIAAPLQQVLFPAFSAIQGDRAQLQSLVMRSGRLLAAALFPVGFGVSALAPELVTILYGPRWAEMIPIVSLFGLGAAVRGSTALATPLLNANNRVGLSLKYNIANTVMMLVLVVIALPHGLYGVAIAVTVASMFPLMIYRVGIGYVGMTNWHMLRIMGPPAVAASIMWASITASRTSASAYIANDAARLLAVAAFAAVLYCAVLAVISKAHIVDVRAAILKLLKRA